MLLLEEILIEVAMIVAVVASILLLAGFLRLAARELFSRPASARTLSHPRVRARSVHGLFTRARNTFTGTPATSPARSRRLP